MNSITCIKPEQSTLCLEVIKIRAYSGALQKVFQYWNEWTKLEKRTICGITL
jgi:hypothetical protein